jgi:hypothetical protein
MMAAMKIRDAMGREKWVEKQWKPLDHCQTCGNAEIVDVEYVDDSTGYRDVAYICANGHRVDEQMVDLEAA